MLLEWNTVLIIWHCDNFRYHSSVSYYQLFVMIALQWECSYELQQNIFESLCALPKCLYLTCSVTNQTTLWAFWALISLYNQYLIINYFVCIRNANHARVTAPTFTENNCTWNNRNCTKWRLAPPRLGLEPATPRLLVDCSNHWATWIWSFQIHSLEYRHHRRYWYFVWNG